MSAHLRSRRDYGQKEWVTRDEMVAVCPTCADKMDEKGLTHIRASVVGAALKKAGASDDKVVKMLGKSRTAVERKTIGGVELEAVRKTRPRPHWVVKVVKTGEVFEDQQYFTKPKMWDDLEHILRVIGEERFKRDFKASSRMAAFSQKEAEKMSAKIGKNLAEAWDNLDSAQNDTQALLRKYAAFIKDTAPLMRLPAALEKLKYGISGLHRGRAVVEFDSNVFNASSGRTAYRHYRNMRGDPRWMKSRYSGVAVDGTTFDKGDDILYWPRMPRGKNIMVGEQAKAAWEQFQSEAADEEFMSPGGHYGSDDIVKALAEIAEVLTEE